MSISFMQKVILRINPASILNTNVFSSITEDTLGFAFDNGFNIYQIPQHRFSELIENRNFINQIVSLNDKEFVNFINNNSALIYSISNAFDNRNDVATYSKLKIIRNDWNTRFMAIDFKSLDVDSFRLLICHNSRCLIYAIQNAPELISGLPNDTKITIEPSYYDDVIRSNRKIIINLFRLSK